MLVRCPTVDLVREQAHTLNTVTKMGHDRYYITSFIEFLEDDDQEMYWYLSTEIRAKSYDEALEVGKRSVISSDHVAEEVVDKVYEDEIYYLYYCFYLDKEGHHSAMLEAKKKHNNKYNYNQNLKTTKHQNLIMTQILKKFEQA